MDVIPYVRYIFVFVLAGILIYVFNNVIGIVQEYFPGTGAYTGVMSMIWHGFVFIVVFVETLRLIRAVQIRRLGGI